MKNFKSLAANKLGGAVRHIGIILCLCLCVFAISAQAQNIKLDNAAVLKMKAAGLDDATIVKAIESSPGAYNTSPDGLISLKTGGAGPDVLNAILNHANGAASSDAKQIGKKQDGLPEELGIYYLKGDKYFSIEPEIMNVRTTNSLATAYSMGAKALKVNGWVTGSTVRLNSHPMSMPFSSTSQRASRRQSIRSFGFTKKVTVAKSNSARRASA